MQGVDFAGIDQNLIGWAALRAGGISFVIVRATAGLTKDQLFRRYWDPMKTAGLIRGAYAYYIPTLDPKRQAEAFIGQVGDLGPGDFPPTIDLETVSGKKPADVVAGFHVFAATLEARYGIPPMVYTSRRFCFEDLRGYPLGDVAHMPLWTVDYREGEHGEPRTPDEWGAGGWTLCQYSGDKRGVPGVSGKADLDRFNPNMRHGLGDVEAVKAYQSAHGLTPDGIVGPRTWAQLCWKKT